MTLKFSKYFLEAFREELNFSVFFPKMSPLNIL